MRTASKGRTHGCTDQPAGVKKVLANSEPSTHGTKRPLFHKWRPSAPSGAGPDARPRGTLKQCFERGRYSECLSIAVDKPGDLQPKRQTVILQYGQRDRGDAE